MTACPVCGATELSWADQKFGHCNRRLPQIRRGHDATVEGHHPGLGYVTGSADLQKKVDAAKRAGYNVRKPEDLNLPDSVQRPRTEKPVPGAWERTLKQIDNGLLDGL